jgi:hypothetical protein
VTAPPAPEDPEGQDPAPEWFSAERPIMSQVIADLRRLKYRAKALLLPILLLAALLTAGLVYRMLTKPQLHIARVVLALSEGEASQRNAPLPMRDLRAYVTTVLMPAAEMIALCEERDLFPLRRKLGNEFALTELWDITEVEIFRNYFLFEQSQMPERSARIAITVTWNDPDEAYEIAHALSTMVINSAAAERQRAAQVIADDADRARGVAHGQVEDLEAQLARLSSQLAAAEDAGLAGKVEALKLESATIESSLRRARESLSALTRVTSADQLQAAVYDAGLGLDVQMVEERKPEPAAPRGYRTAVLAVMIFLVLSIVVALFVGAFDTRIHDLDDVTRLGIPVVGQVPGFPGDDVGSLRERGIRRRGVPWSWR